MSTPPGFTTRVTTMGTSMGHHHGAPPRAAGKENGPLIGSMDYEQLLAEGDPMAPWEPPPDEWDALSLCYTSGTTADPKGESRAESVMMG